MKHATKQARCVGLIIAAHCLFYGSQHEARAQQSTAPVKRPAAAQSTHASDNRGAASSADSTVNAPREIRTRGSERAVDASIPDDPAVDKILAPYSAKVRELDTVIGRLQGNLKKKGMGAGSLGNFVADAIRATSEATLGKPVLLAITNSGGLRKNDIGEGDIRASDVYQLLPFENSLVALDLTGEQLRRFLDVIIKHRDAQSGARISYRTNAKEESEIISAKLVSSGDGNEKEIDPAATYTIVTIDYLVKRGGDYSILREAKNVRPLNLTLRDAVLTYVRSETAAKRPIKAALDGRFSFAGDGKDSSEGDQP